MEDDPLAKREPLVCRYMVKRKERRCVILMCLVTIVMKRGTSNRDALTNLKKLKELTRMAVVV